MTDNRNVTDERIDRLEQRLEQLEQLAERWQERYARFMAGPGRKVLKVFGIEPPP